MTDLPPLPSIPSRLGVTLDLTEGGLTAQLRPAPPTCIHGTVRASALVFLVDVVGGLEVDTDPDAWCFTSDLSLRAPADPAPAAIHARAHTLRAGNRSVTSEVPLRVGDAEPWGHAVIGFARLPRREHDLEKPDIDLAEAAAAWREIPLIDVPLREAAGIRRQDPTAGAVSVELRDELLNPAGALQGAMVSLVVEAAAEDLGEHHLGPPRVVTELDIRFLTQARSGPVTSRARFVGPPADGSVVVELVDEGDRSRVVATALARLRRAATAAQPA